MNTNTQNSMNESIGFATAYLRFNNVKGDYVENGIITKKNSLNESKYSPLMQLARFTKIRVDECSVNESTGTKSICVQVNAVGRKNMERLYEWLKINTDESKISEIAPNLLEALDIEPNEAVNESHNESNNEKSVASRFAKYRKLYESDDEEKDDKKDEAPTDENPDDTADKEKEENTDDEEVVELTAIVIEVKKGDEDAAKEELIDAGVDEDDIEILKPESKKDKDENDEENDDESEEQNESEDEDEESDDEESEEETVKIKVSVDSFDALKEYLEKKGYDVENDILGGGEIVDKDDDEEGEEGDDKEKKEVNSTFDQFDDLFADDDSK
jgi:hypothetical protein